MQRIGRVNRIGSTAGIIYNYVFYPSEQGNKEIKLNQIALSKIQTFHTTFGEDNQIYSTDEIIDRDLDKLFQEGIKKEQEDRNLELPFYEELRSLYQQNRKEYQRIERISLRSRTGREPYEVEGITLSGGTMVFLKTNFRKVFYLVNDEKARELSVLDALKYFKAEREEKAVPRLPQHHEHVEKALNAFRTAKEEELHDEESNQSQRSNHGCSGYDSCQPHQQYDTSHRGRRHSFETCSAERTDRARNHHLYRQTPAAHTERPDATGRQSSQDDF